MLSSCQLTRNPRAETLVTEIESIAARIPSGVKASPWTELELN